MSDPLIKPYNPLARFLPPNTPPNVRPPEKAAAPTETSAPTPATAPASQGKAPSASPSVANPPSAEKTREAAQSGSVDSETAAHLTPAVNGFWEQAETGMEAIQQENAYHLEGPHGEVSQALESSISDVQGLVDAHRDGTSGHTLSESDLKMLEHGLQQEVQGLLQLAADTQDEDSLRRSNDPEIQKILADSPPGRINIEALEDYIDSRLDQVDRKLSHAESNPHSFASESRHKAELATRQTGDAAAISRAPRPPEIHTSALEQRLNDLRERIAAGNNPRDLQIFERIVQNMSEESERFLEDTHDIFDNIVKLERPLVVELDGVHKDLLSIYAEITKADNPHGSAARVTGRIGKAISVYDRIKSIGGLILADSAAERFGRGAEIIANIAGSPFGPMYAAAVEQAEIFAESFQSRQDMLDLMSLASKYLDGDITDTLNVLVPYQRAKK